MKKASTVPFSMAIGNVHSYTCVVPYTCNNNKNEIRLRDRRQTEKSEYGKYSGDEMKKLKKGIGAAGPTKEDIGIEQQLYEIVRGKNFALNCLS